ARSSNQIGIGTHCRGDLVAAFEPGQACERVGHSFQRQSEREDAAPVYRVDDLVLVNLRRLGVEGEHLPLHAMPLEPVTVAPPTFGAAESEHAGVLAGTVVL